jgi:CBS domain-containing protein
MALLAKEIMVTPVVSVEADTPLKKAAEILDEYSFSGVPVIDGEEKVVGVISESDILGYTRQIIGQPLRDPHRVLSDKNEVLHVNISHRGVEIIELVASTNVDMVMTREVITVAGDTALHEIVNLMHRYDINRVPVVGKSGQLIGIITRADLIRALYAYWETFNRD